MPNGIVRVVLEAQGLGQVRNALRGVVGESRRADQAMSQSAQQLGRQRVQAARDERGRFIAGARARVSAEQEADRAIIDSARRTSRERQRLASAEARELRQRLRAERSGSGGGGIRGIATAGLGAAAAVGARVSGYGAAVGIPDQAQMIRNFIENEQRFLRTAAQAGISRGRVGEIQASVQTTALRTSTDQGQLYAALETAQTRFSDLEYFAENIEQIARATQAGGGDMQDWVGAIGEFRRQLGVSSQDVPELLGIMVDAMARGSIEAGDIAANFSDLLSMYRTLRGDAGAGLGGAREFVALAESLGAGGMSAPETATVMQAFMRTLSSSDRQGALEESLGDTNIFDSSGRLQMGIPELVSRMAQSGRFNDPAEVENFFGGGGDIRERRALLMLMNTELNNPEQSVGALAQASGARGQELIDSTMDMLQNSTSGRAMRAAVEAEVNFARNGEQVVQLMTEMGSEMSRLTTRYPMATEALGMLRDAAAGAGLSLMMLGGGGALGGGLRGALGGASSLMGGGGIGGGVAAGALGALAVPLAVGGAAVVGAAAYSAYQDEQLARQRESVDRVLQTGSWADREAALEQSAALHGDVEGAAGMARRRAGRATAEATMAASGLGDRLSVGLTEDSIRRMSTEIAGAIARGAPADGRDPGAPGRR